MKKSLLPSVFLFAALVLFCGPRALADIVYFDDMDRGPSEKLHVDGVTVLGGAFFGFDVDSMPTTVSGVGLGSATIGAPGTVDRIQNITGYMRESLSLSVFGAINSITIAPYFSVVGADKGIFLPFDVSLTYFGVPVIYTTAFNDSPFTIPIYSSAFGDVDQLKIGLQADFGNIPVILYLQDHPDATVQFGFSIVSLDYTPAGVPEASTMMLLGVGLLGIWLKRRIELGNQETRKAGR